MMGRFVSVRLKMFPEGVYWRIDGTTPFNTRRFSWRISKKGINV
jgi:hypothetical protein